MTLALQPRKQKGFTIIEFMISMTIVSVLMLILFVGILYISRIYYKGVTMSRTQETVRRVTEVLAKDIQFSPQVGGKSTIVAVTGSGPQVVCIGTTKYTFEIDKQVKSTPTSADQQKNALYAQTIASGCSDAEAPINLAGATGGTELLNDGARLLALEVTPYNIAKTVWKIRVKIGYGNADVFTSPVGSPASDKKCKGSAVDSQFCSIAELETTVQRRVE